jgi:hypothetical protein
MKKINYFERKKDTKKKVKEKKLSSQSPFSSHQWLSKWILPHFQ